MDSGFLLCFGTVTGCALCLATPGYAYPAMLTRLLTLLTRLLALLTRLCLPGCWLYLSSYAYPADGYAYPATGYAYLATCRACWTFPDCPEYIAVHLYIVLAL